MDNETFLVEVHVRRRTLIRASVVLAILLAASLSTVRARQVLAEDQARARFLAAQTWADAALRHATAVGVPSSELAPFQLRTVALGRARPPASTPLLGAETVGFYQRGARAAQTLERDVVELIRRVTVDSRRHAHRVILALRRQVAVAASLDIGANVTRTILAEERAAFDHSKMPKQYFAISAMIRDPLAELGMAIRVRQRQVTSILSEAHHDRAAVIRHADQEVAAAQRQLWLLALVTSRAGQYRAALEGLLSAVHGAPTAFASAVKESALQAEMTGLSADYSRTVPLKLIVVSTEKQSVRLFEHGNQIYSTPATTGGPELPTDHGIFHIYLKLTPFTFHSPWPPGSPYYYPDTPIQYWMPFDGGEGLHDAWWRSNFGPGSNLAPTYLGTGNSILGTHGCVNLPADAAQFVWTWAPVGTTVVVV